MEDVSVPRSCPGGAEEGAPPGLTPGTQTSELLRPAGATESLAYGVHAGQQVGYARVGDVARASLWRSTAASWVDLTPAGSNWSGLYAAHDGQQVGYAEVGGTQCASLWRGTAASWVNLHALLPPDL